MIITEVGKEAMLLTQDHGTRCAMETIAYSEHKLDLTRPDEITEKNTNKREVTELSNINGLELQFHDITVTWVF